MTRAEIHTEACRSRLYVALGRDEDDLYDALRWCLTLKPELADVIEQALLDHGDETAKRAQPDLAAS